MKIAIFDYVSTKPFQIFGLTGKFWTVHIDTLLYTWAAMAMLFVIMFLGHRKFQRKGNLGMASMMYEQVVVFFLDLCKESFGVVNYNYFYFVTSLFLFTFSCCVIALVPFLDEATKDLNTTLAISLISFCYVQYQKIKVVGMLGYFKEFMEPIFLLAPINIVGEVAKIASMSFRLFGNILGGGIIFSMIVQVVDNYNYVFLIYMVAVIVLHQVMKRSRLVAQYKPMITLINRLTFILFLLVWAQIFFGIFEGLIQSFVLTMLTITYLATGIAENTESAEPKKGAA